nr:hypothetical protein OH837_38325 [Streptomyces canus]
MAALLERAVSGNPDGDVGFLNHDEVYDGFADPPRVLGATAVADIAHGLDAIDVGALLKAAAVCGFSPGLVGDVQFHREATHRRWCLVVRGARPEIRDQSHTFCVAVR